jgi:hypothetical protein
MVILAALLMLVGHASAPRADFTELDRFGSWYNRGLAWGDYDRDGDLDLAVATGSGVSSRLYRNDGADVFTELVPFPPHPGAAGARGIAWGDYDNDGDLDLAELLANSYANHIYRNDGGDNFTTLSCIGEEVSQTACWGDYDNDGDLDLAVSNWYSQQNKLFRNEGQDTFTELDEFGADNTCGIAWGDYDNDGDLDLAVANGQGEQNRLYRNEGDGNFTGLNRFGAGEIHGIGWGDYDNDGDLDIVVAPDNMGQCRIYRNDGADEFAEFVIGSPGYHSSVAWGDYDHDGDLDLVVTRYYGDDQNKLFRNDGNDTFTELDEFGQRRSSGIAWGDYDNDGDIDLALLNDREQGNKLFRNEQNTDDYILVELEGRGVEGFTNKDGIGAKVYVYDAGTRALRGFREMASGGGNHSMPMALQAHFGVPTAGIYDVEVVWPVSGVVQRVRNVVPPSRLSILEGDGASQDDSGERLSLCFLAQNSPNPFWNGMVTEIGFSLVQSGETNLSVYDISGRKVRTLIDGHVEAGVHFTEWRGRDDRGQTLPSGIYLYRLESAEARWGRKLELLR